MRRPFAIAAILLTMTVVTDAMFGVGMIMMREFGSVPGRIVSYALFLTIGILVVRFFLWLSRSTS